MCNLIFWILFGGVSGWIANLIVYKRSGGCFTNVLTGIVGSVVGGLIFGFLIRQNVGLNDFGFDGLSLLVAVLGAIILLGIINFARGKR